MGVLLFCLMAFGGSTLADETREVLAPIGSIRGRFNESRLGRRFFSARGIRYAEAPVGDLRFRPPVPAENWTTVFDATTEGPACPQPGALFPSEDCLRLNVYSPELPSSENPKVKKPVMVFFHPGGFYVLSGQGSAFGPEFLMDKDIVLVTVNNRLGTLGWISTGDVEAPGNLGLKDQVVALRWVQRNIAAFGGDPGSVTIFGFSAGGWSVVLHTLSPMSKGLFHRIIAMSGSPTSQKPLGGNQIDIARRQARLLNCTTNTTREMMACFRTKPADAFGNSLVQMFEWNFYPVLVWSPVVEPRVRGVERFLSAEPVDLIRQGKFHQVPVMTGRSTDEFGGDVIGWVEAARNGNDSGFEELNNDWYDLAPLVFQYERRTPRSRNISTGLRSFYFKDQPVSLATTDELGKLLGDSIIGFPVHRLANLVAEYSCQPVYYYEFTYQGRYSFRKWPETNKPYGVSHHDDLLYLFWMKTNFPYFNVTDPEYVTVQRMTSMLTSFAATGNPIPEDDKSFENVRWDVFTPENKKYLNIGSNLTMQTGLYARRMNEWDKLFPLTKSSKGRHCRSRFDHPK